MWNLDAGFGITPAARINRLYDLEARIVADTIYQYVSFVGVIEDSTDNGQWVRVGKHRYGEYNKGSYEVLELNGWNYNVWGSGVAARDEEARWMEESESQEALYILGWRGDSVVVRRVEWRLSHWPDEWGIAACHHQPGFSALINSREMVAEQLFWKTTGVILKRGEVEMIFTRWPSDVCQQQLD